MLQLETIRFSSVPREIRLVGRVLASDHAEQLQAAEQAGYERGVVEGERVLSEQLIQQRGELLALHQGAVLALQQAVPQVVRQLEEAMVGLALEIAQKLVTDSPITQESVANSVREALEQVEDTAEFTVLLHPDDLVLLGLDPAGVINTTGTRQQMRFMATREVSQGGCIVQTRFGTIDTRRETKLAYLSSTLGLS